MAVRDIDEHKANVSERWLSVDEISDHLGITRDTVYRWIEAKHLPAHRIGRLWKFKASQVDQWVEADRLEASPDMDETC